jgi:glycosyltransferase involved in cell wall biosynthesis
VDRLTELLADSELREQMGKQGLERAERFSKDAMIGDIDGLYRELLRESRRVTL